MCVLLIKGYQWCLSPIKDALFGPGCCRFYPTCSQYGVESFQKHGVWGGFWLTFVRIFKCQPYHSGGYDPVPEAPIKYFWKKR
jgi:putative membrane protein insertion efficiency factor